MGFTATRSPVVQQQSMVIVTTDHAVMARGVAACRLCQWRTPQIVATLRAALTVIPPPAVLVVDLSTVLATRDGTPARDLQRLRQLAPRTAVLLAAPLRQRTTEELHLLVELSRVVNAEQAPPVLTAAEVLNEQAWCAAMYAASQASQLLRDSVCDDFVHTWLATPGTEQVSTATLRTIVQLLSRAPEVSKVKELACGSSGGGGSSLLASRMRQYRVWQHIMEEVPVQAKNLVLLGKVFWYRALLHRGHVRKAALLELGLTSDAFRRSLQSRLGIGLPQLEQAPAPVVYSAVCQVLVQGDAHLAEAFRTLRA